MIHSNKDRAGFGTVGAEPLERRLECGGLDGSNPLAFLGALGLLWTADSVAPDGSAVRLRWTRRGAAWIAELSGSAPYLDSGETLLDAITPALSVAPPDHASRIWSVVLRGNLSERRRLADDAGRPGSGVDPRMLGGIGVDTLTPSRNEWQASKTDPSDTQLRTTRRDYHIGNLQSILLRTERDHLARAIFHSWDYADAMANQSLHLDPSEDRRHAYQWYQPSSDPSRHREGNMLGANRLAVEGFRLLSTYPVPARAKDRTVFLATSGFRGQSSKDTFWRWPIWEVPIPAAIVPSVLSLRELQEADPHLLADRGIASVFECRRILVGKTPNLTPAHAIGR